jgi:hypothetical protein
LNLYNQTTLLTHPRLLQKDTQDKTKDDTMDPLPPNDPNRNNNNNNGRIQAKPDPTANAQGAEMDIIGDLQDQPVVVVMFLVAAAAWLLQEHCTC